MILNIKNLDENTTAIKLERVEPSDSASEFFDEYRVVFSAPDNAIVFDTSEFVSDSEEFDNIAYCFNLFIKAEYPGSVTFLDNIRWALTAPAVPRGESLFSFKFYPKGGYLFGDFAYLKD